MRYRHRQPPKKKLPRINGPLRSVAYLVFFVLIFFTFSILYKSESKTLFHINLPNNGIEASSLAVIIKKGDRFSEQTAALYQKHRNIPKNNLFYIDLPNTDNVSATDFQIAYKKLIDKLPNRIQAMVATWQAPYRVDCMSITSAMTFGFDKKWCQPDNTGCATTQENPYFNHTTRYPFYLLGIRPTMLLTGDSLSDVEDLILRGVRADFSYPHKAQAYLVKTKDPHRNVRWEHFKTAAHSIRDSNLQIHYRDLSAPSNRDYITGKELLIYQTGLPHVPGIHKNNYLPGAIADHLTSFGGQGIDGTGQMSAFRWLEAGATGSYGTVVEPCNFTEKFPNPNQFIPHYRAGETLIEAYWKSVKMPGEGLFIGEPLARPYGVLKHSISSNHFAMFTNRLDPRFQYQIYFYNHQARAFQKAEKYSIHYLPKRKLSLIQIDSLQSNQYKVIRIPSQQTRAPHAHNN